MEVRTGDPYVETGGDKNEATPGNAGTPASGWATVGLLYRHRWFVFGVTALMAVAAVAITLMMPVEYRAGARVMLPDQSGGGLGALIGRLSPTATALLGGGGAGGNYNRFLAVMSSETVLKRAVDRFDLERVYEVKGKPRARALALAELSARIETEVDLKLEYLTVGVLDRDPRRASEIANFLVEQTNLYSATLSTQDAANYRRYVQGRYEEATADLDSARLEMRAFQERYGVVELPVMAEAYMKAAADQRALSINGEVQYEALLQQYGPENPQVLSARQALESIRRNESALLDGRDRLLPVALRQLPELSSEYARVRQEILIQTEILKISQPMYEQARFQEERDKVMVQVVDAATPPDRKAEPQRARIVLGVTVSAFMLALAFVLLRAWLRRHRGALTQALRA